MNPVLENLETRRSCRNYTEEQIKDCDLDAILRAGTFAASGMNRQSTYLVAVRDRETRDLLSKLNAGIMNSQNDPFYGAPCVVVVLAAPDPTFVEDGSLVMGNLMNAAHALGLGSCWIHRAKQVFELPEGKALLEKWGLPDNLVGIGNCILGYEAEVPAEKPRKEGRIIKID
ncbi:MAG: nitroreductase [Oscillospiraceae bacterium]|nr:nitroreductase [Oscillospiraceae bacterium]